MEKPEFTPKIEPIEEQLGQLYGVPQPRAEFARQLEADLMAQARQQAAGTQRDTRFPDLAKTGRWAFAAAGLALVVLLIAFSVRLLLPAGPPPTGANLTVTPSPTGAAPTAAVIAATEAEAAVTPTAVPFPAPSVPVLSAESCAQMAPLPKGYDMWTTRPSQALGGGSVQSGGFTLGIWLLCDDQFGSGGSTASEIEKLGVYLAWRYQGEHQDGDVFAFSGVEPYVQERSSIGPTLDKDMTSEDTLGIVFPESVFPDFSRGETRLRYIYRLKLPDGQQYGAALDFTLRPAPDGYLIEIDPINALSPEQIAATELAPTATPPFPLHDPAQIEPLLGELQALAERGSAGLGTAPGWVHYKTHNTSSDKPWSLPNGAVVGPETLDDHWFLADENGRVTAMIYRMLDMDENPLQETIYTNGLYRNLTLGDTTENAPPPLVWGADYGFLNQTAGSLKTGGRLSKEDTTLENGAPGVLFTIESTDGKRTALFDATSGKLLAQEIWIKSPDGTEKRTYRMEALASETVSVPPAGILALLEQPLTPYQPLPPQGTPAPQGFDPSGSTLSMTMVAGDDPNTPNFWYGDLYASGVPTASVLTASYLLGRVDFGNVPGGWCDRSADGSKLAFNYVAASNERPYETTLRWFDLRQIDVVHNPIPHISMVSPPSWAPQGSQMAFFACAGETQCGVYLLDATTDQARWLSAISGSGMPPVLKPAGPQIAFFLI